jgi:hypothetical protein
LTEGDCHVLFLFMTTRTDMAERHDAALIELADLGMSLARDLHARALAADNDGAGDLALAFHRISRSVRQTLALEARLKRERTLADREAAQIAARERLDRVQKKRAQLRDAVAPLVWTEVEGDEDEYEDLLEQAEALAFKVSEDDDFLDIPMDACLARIRVDLGLAAASLVADEADQVEEPSAAPRRSSS